VPFPDPNADCMVPAGTVVALEQPAMHVAVHWFILTCCTRTCPHLYLYVNVL